MKTTSPKIIILIMLFAFALASVSCNRDKVSDKGTSNLSPEQAKMAEARLKSIEESKKSTVAKVNGVNISMFELVNEMNQVAPQYLKSAQKGDQKVDEQVKKEALDRLIYRELAIQEAVREGLKVPPEGIENEMKKFKTSLQSEDAYREKLRQLGLTEEEFKKQIERSILVDMITEKEIFDKIKIDPNQVKKTYAKDKASYKGTSGQMSFEEARPLIEQKLMTPLVHKREDEWVDGLKRAAKIEIAPAQSTEGVHSIK